jgi:flagellar hook-associated protein 2
MAGPSFNIGGLASGLDTNTIIDQLMSIERQPQVRLQQRELVEEARQSALKDVLTRLNNLKTAGAALRDPTIWADTQSVESSDAGKLTASRTAGAAAGSYQITIGALARAHQITQGGSITSAAADDRLHLRVGTGATIDVDVAAGDSLDTIASKINSTVDIPVYASVVNSKLVVTSKTTGAANTISATSDGSLATDLGFTTTLAAQDASYTVDGNPKTSASNTVTDAIVGLTVTLKAQTAVGAPVSVTVGAPAPDTEKIQEKVQAFVDQYNSTVDFIRGKLSEKKVRDPQTAAERAQGVLANDAGLNQILSSLRTMVADVTTGRPGDVDQLSEIGISTGATTGSGSVNQDAVAGKLVLDAGKLSTMLATRFGDVKALFSNKTDVYGTEGFSQRLDRILDPQVTASSGVLAQRISSQQSLIDSLKDSESALETRLAEREKRLRAQFTALETALAKIQSQNTYVSGQLAALQTPSSS